MFVKKTGCVSGGRKRRLLLMKILITTDLYTVKTNGVVTSVNNLTDGLRRKGHDVRILTLSDNAWSYVQDDVYYIGSFPLGKVYPGVRGAFPHRNHILNELIEWCPDIIHSQCEFFTFQFAKLISKRCDAPIVHTYHTLYESYVGYLGIPEAANKKIVKLLSKRRLKAAETIIAPSQKTLSVLKGYGMDQDIEVVPTGISIDQHLERYSAEKKRELRRAIGIREDAFVLISIGRLGKEKNIDELLIGMSKVIDENPDVILLIVGDGPDRKELERHVRNLGLENNVDFTGAVPPKDVHAYYQISDVFVSASTSETQGLVFIEAAANGLPFICHRDSCLRGIIDENQNGFCYETIEEFQNAFAQCLNCKGFRENASEISRKNALKYGKQQFADRIEHVYYSLVPQERRGMARDEIIH